MANALDAQSFQAGIPQGQTAPSRSSAQGLTVFVLQGDKAVNYIPDKRGTTPIVEVRDQSGLPIEGAQVVFSLPPNGPSGVFSGGQRTTMVRSNSDGQAAVPFTINGPPGRFQIQVAATFGDQIGSAVITQTNSMQVSVGRNGSRPWYKTWKMWAVIGGAGAAAALAIVLSSRGGSTPTVTITPGAPTIGHP